MTKALKRLGMLAIVLAALVAYILIIRRQLDYPWLHVDLRAAGVENVLWFGGTVLAFALACVFAVYLLFNADGPFRRLPLPLLAFAGLLALSGWCFGFAAEGVPCTYTSGVASFEELFSAERFQSGSLRVYPQRLTGNVSDYVYYENGEVRAETVSVRHLYDATLDDEQRRLDNLGAESFTEGKTTCYTFRTPLVIWQVVVSRDENLVTYSRYDHPEAIPSYLPQPLEPTEEQTRPAGSSGRKEPSGAETEPAEPESQPSEPESQTSGTL